MTLKSNMKHMMKSERGHLTHIFKALTTYSCRWGFQQPVHNFHQEIKAVVSGYVAENA